MLAIPFRCEIATWVDFPDALSAPMIHGILLAATCKPPDKLAHRDLKIEQS